jgi:hypothetical protein
MFNTTHKSHDKFDDAYIRHYYRLDVIKLQLNVNEVDHIHWAQDDTLIDLLVAIQILSPYFIPNHKCGSNVQRSECKPCFVGVLRGGCRMSMPTIHPVAVHIDYVHDIDGDTSSIYGCHYIIHSDIHTSKPDVNVL